MYIDTHAHTYDEQYKEDIEQAMERCVQQHVQRIYMPNCDSTTIAPMLAIEAIYPATCFAMMGLHPCYVKENVQDELNTVYDWLQKRKFKAVGEIGLDYYWDKTFVDAQKKALHQQIEWALEFDIPIVLHTRDSIQDTIDIVQQYVPKNIRGVYHCFSGSYESAMQIVKQNFYVGIGGVVTFKNAGVQDVVKKLDLKHIVLETDAPYLAPTPYRGKRNESSYLNLVAEKIAELKNISVEEVERITTENAMALFKEI